MPTYDYLCEKCSVEFDALTTIDKRRETKCPHCGGITKLLLPKRPPAAVNFRPGWYENIALDPIHCNTPQELRNACDENNAYSVYLENSSFKTSPGPDPDPEVRDEVRGGYGLSQNRDSDDYLPVRRGS